MNTSVGYVYVLTNEYVPGLVKVGFTGRDPHTRADELSNVTGVPGKWKVFHSWKLEDPYAAEQEIFSHLKLYRQAGEFLKLRPDDAVEKISVVLAAKGRIDIGGLSPVARKEADQLRKEQLFRREQEELRRLFTQIDKELRDAAEQASSELFEQKLPQMKRKQIRNAFVWGGGAFLVGLAFVSKVEGAFLLAGIFALFAYFLGDGWSKISNSDQAKHARTEAIRAVWTKYGFGYLFTDPPVEYRDNQGIVFDDADQYEYDRFDTIRDKRSGNKYKRDRDYLSVGNYLPCFKIILSTKRIMVEK